MKKVVSLNEWVENKSLLEEGKFKAGQVWIWKHVDGDKEVEVVDVKSNGDVVGKAKGTSNEFIVREPNKWLKKKVSESIEVNESYKVFGKEVTLNKGEKANGTDWTVTFKDGKTVPLSDVLASIKPFPAGITKESLAEVNEGKDDFMARHSGTDIWLKKGYKNHTEAELQELYFKIGELLKDNLDVKTVTVVFESVVTEANVSKMSTDQLKKMIKQSEDERVSPVFAAQIKAARAELKKRGESLVESVESLDVNEAYDVELFWKGLSGEDKKIGRFLVSKKDYEALEDDFGSEIEFDLHDDKASGKMVKFDDVVSAMKNTKYGKTAMKESINEGRSINRIQNDWSKTTAEMAAKAQEWKAAEGDAKAALLDELKALNAKKGALEVELDAAVTGKDKDLELAIRD